MPIQMSSRTQCWVLTLGSYEYSSAARPMTQHDNVDAISRLSLKFKPTLAPQPPEFVLTLDTLLNSYYMLTDPDRIQRYPLCYS